MGNTEVSLPGIRSGFFSIVTGVLLSEVDDVADSSVGVLTLGVCKAAEFMSGAGTCGVELDDVVTNPVIVVEFAGLLTAHCMVPIVDIGLLLPVAGYKV